jgi:hypothetical protein
LKNSTVTFPAEVSAKWGWLLSSETCIYVYIGLILSIIFLIILKVICFFTMCTRASVRLHDSMFSSITHATMAFFSHNPSGKGNASNTINFMLYDSKCHLTWSFLNVARYLVRCIVMFLKLEAMAPQGVMLFHLGC